MNSIRLIFGLMTLGITALIVMTQTTSGNALNESHSKYKLEGSWMIDGTPASGSPIPPFKALATFAAGGGVVETVLLPPVVTPAHGVWEKLGKREYTFAVVHHLVDQSGNPTGTVKAKTILKLTSRNEFEATFEGTFFDPQGNPLFPISGTETGTRITVD
jgi:hypothetical protein